MMSAVFHNDRDIIEVKEDWLARLKREASLAPLRRARLCLHRGDRDKVHEMLIVFCRDSLVRPHRHIGKSESFHVIEGALLVLLLDQRGKLANCIEMGPIGSGKTFMYRLESEAWHTVIPLSEFVAIHETTAGPFVKSEDDFAPWAPTDERKLKAFLSDLLDEAKEMQNLRR